MARQRTPKIPDESGEKAPAEVKVAAPEVQVETPVAPEPEAALSQPPEPVVETPAPEPEAVQPEPQPVLDIVPNHFEQTFSLEEYAQFRRLSAGQVGILKYVAKSYPRTIGEWDNIKIANLGG